MAFTVQWRFEKWPPQWDKFSCCCQRFFRPERILALLCVCMCACRGRTLCFQTEHFLCCSLESCLQSLLLQLPPNNAALYCCLLQRKALKIPSCIYRTSSLPGHLMDRQASTPHVLYYFLKYLFIWLHWVLVVAHRVFFASCRIFHCSTWTL